MTAMVVVGRLSGKFDARILILTGLLCISYSLWEMTKFTTDSSSFDLIRTGVIQGFGFGFVFVPLTTITFATLEPRYRTEGTSMYSLIRNIGSSIGISIVTTFLAQSTQRNHAVFAEFINPDNHALSQAIGTGLFSENTYGLTILNKLVTGQAATLAYLQDFRFMMFVTLAAVPMLLLMSSAHKRH